MLIINTSLCTQYLQDCGIITNMNPKDHLLESNFRLAEILWLNCFNAYITLPEIWMRNAFDAKYDVLNTNLKYENVRFYIFTNAKLFNKCKTCHAHFQGQLTILIMEKKMKIPDSKVHGASMGPTWDRQDPGGPHIWETAKRYLVSISSWCVGPGLLQKKATMPIDDLAHFILRLSSTLRLLWSAYALFIDGQ